MTDTSSPPSEAPPIGETDFIHELFWEQIRRLFMEELQKAGPKMGRVASFDGTNIRVLIDGTNFPRSMPRVSGQRYDIGMRVVVGIIQGRPVCLGSVTTGSGSDPVIGTPDIRDLSITMAKLADDVSFLPPQRSIVNNMVVVKALMGAAAVGNDNSVFSPGGIGSADIGAGQVTNAKIASVDASKISGRVSSDQIGAIANINNNGNITWAGGVVGIQGGNIDNNAVGNRCLQEDAVDQRVLANQSVGWQNCTLELQAIIKKAGKGKGKTKSFVSQGWSQSAPENFPPEDGRND